MNLKPSIDSIIAKIQAEAAEASPVLDCDVVEVPDAPSGFKEGQAKPVIYVIFLGSTALPKHTANVVSQKRLLKINIEVHTRSLQLMHLCRHIVELAVVGFRPEKCQEMTLVKDDFTQAEDNSKWIHVYEFQCESLLIQKQHSDAVLVPQLQEVKYPGS